MGKSLIAQPGEIINMGTIISSVPAGATTTTTVDLPPGVYNINIYGTQAAATTAPTFTLSKFVNAAQTASVVLPGALHDDTGFSATAIPLDVAKTTLSMNFHANPNLGVVAGLSGVYVPYGLTFTYTKNGGTAINLELAVVRVA